MTECDKQFIYLPTLYKKTSTAFFTLEEFHYFYSKLKGQVSLTTLDYILTQSFKAILEPFNQTSFLDYPESLFVKPHNQQASST